MSNGDPPSMRRFWCASISPRLRDRAPQGGRDRGQRSDAGRCALSARRYQNRLIDVDLRELALKIVDLGQVVIDDVGIARISDQKILVVAFSRIEALERIDPGDNRRVEHVCLLEL